MNYRMGEAGGLIGCTSRNIVLLFRTTGSCNNIIMYQIYERLGAKVEVSILNIYGM